MSLEIRKRVPLAARSSASDAPSISSQTISRESSARRLASAPPKKDRSQLTSPPTEDERREPHTSAEGRSMDPRKSATGEMRCFRETDSCARFVGLVAEDFRPTISSHTARIPSFALTSRTEGRFACRATSSRQHTGGAGTGSRCAGNEIAVRRLAQEYLFTEGRP